MMPSQDAIDFDIKLSINGFLLEKDVVEEIRLLADSMSTHKALAEKIGISDAYLCDVLEGRRAPGPKILTFLKLKRVVVYAEAPAKGE